jgi:single-strand DNA-binding protein
MRTTQAGKKIATLNIATSESWKDQRSGEWAERTEWHRVVIFNEGLAKIAETHLSQGMKVRVEGKLRTRKWQDKQGNDRFTTEIIADNMQMLGGRGGGAGGSGGAERAGGGGAAPPRDDFDQSPPAPSGGKEEFDDDIPF